MTDLFSMWSKLNLMRKLCMAVLMMAALAQAESGQDLFQKALVAERANGKLEEAIKLYQRIAQKFASDRSLAAKALLQMGQCYEKLGDTQARKAYDRVVREYTDQNEVVLVARAGLGRLGPGTENRKPEDVRVKRIQVADAIDSIRSISPDGRYLAFLEGENQFGNVAVLDLARAEKRTVKQFSVKPGAWTPVFSPDSQQIAFAARGDGGPELRVINLDGSGERVVHRLEPGMGLNALFSWEAGNIVATFLPRDQTKKPQIVAISLADGSVRTLKTFDRGPGLSIRMSPDGLWVATSIRDSSIERTLFLISTTDGREVSLLKQTGGDEEVAGWTLDGKAILFTSNPGGHNNLYGLRVENGRALGSPALIRNDVRDLHAIGVTRQGSLYYNSWTGSSNVFSAILNPDTGRIESAPALATSLSIGENSLPSWSPDGSKMAYHRGRALEPGSGQREYTVAILNLASGSVREIAPRLSEFQPRQWRPDGKAILGVGTSSDGKQGIFSIDVQTGEPTALVLRESDADRLQNPVWSPDGKSILYRRAYASGVSILLRSLDNGRTRELFRSAPSRATSLAVSPDGSQLAFFNGNAIMALPVAGGVARTIFELKPPELFGVMGGLAWMPDGRRLLFLKQPTASWQSPYTLWRVSADGGEPENTGLTVKGMQVLSVHPDGRRIGFSADASSGRPETWAVEGFAGLLR